MNDKYPLSLRILHWLIGILVMTLLIVGFSMANFIEPPLKYTLYGLHKSVGLVVFTLTLLRISIRLISSTPAFPPTVACYERALAKLTYLALYAVTLAFPLSGYIMSAAGGHPVALFGLNVPLLMEKNMALAHTAKELHEIFGYVLTGLIVLHFLGFLKHLLFDKENLLKRIW